MRRVPLTLSVLLLLVSLPDIASAQAYAIGPGREREVLALFAPHALGEEVSAGWTLSNVSIERTTIVATLAGPSDPIRLELRHRTRPTTAARSASFSFQEEDAPGHAATASLMAAVRVNDDGTFWDARGLVDSVPQITTGLVEAASAAPSSDRGLLETVSTGSILIHRASPAASLATALLALFIAAGSLFLRRAR